MEIKRERNNELKTRSQKVNWKVYDDVAKRKQQAVLIRLHAYSTRAAIDAVDTINLKVIRVIDPWL